jgi:hypothetical protein
MPIDTEQKLIRAGFTSAGAAVKLGELASLWPATDFTPVRWDCLKNVFAGPRPASTYRAVYGSWWPLRDRSRIDKLRKSVLTLVPLSRWISHPSAFLMPKDAILFARAVTQSLVVVSASHGRVLKLAAPGRRDLLVTEAATLRRVSAAGLAERAPKIVAEGDSSAGDRWLLTELADNRNPIDRPLWTKRSPHDTWRAWLVDRILPEMQRYYESGGIDVKGAEEALSEMAERISGHPRFVELNRVLNWASEIPRRSPACVVRCQVHGDLKPAHVHRSGDSWKLIDWGGGEWRSVTKDFFGPVSVPGAGRLTAAYWTWMKGQLASEELPRPLQQDIAAYAKWMGKWLDLEIDASTVRFQALFDVLQIECARRERGVTKFDSRELDALQTDSQPARSSPPIPQAVPS